MDNAQSLGSYFRSVPYHFDTIECDWVFGGGKSHTFYISRSYIMGLYVCLYTHIHTYIYLYIYTYYI